MRQGGQVLWLPAGLGSLHLCSRRLEVAGHSSRVVKG